MYCTKLKGVGPKIASHLTRLGINTVQDLLFHLPLRYEDRTVTKPLNLLRPGEQVQVEGKVVDALLSKGRRRNFLLRIEDKTGFLTLRFFNFNQTQVNTLSSMGQRLQCYGIVKWGRSGYEMIHPEYKILGENQIATIESYLTAIYPTTEGLHQLSLRKLISQALSLFEQQIELNELFPQEFLSRYSLPALREAIHFIHRPSATTSKEVLEQRRHPSFQRLIFEELLAHQLSLARIKARAKILQSPKIIQKQQLTDTFLKNLSFELTVAQQKVIHEITADLNKDVPMLRLVQGDVGSGKTIVAALVALHVIGSRLQVALMVPTELLAEQHYKNFLNWFEPLGITVAWLTNATKGRVREELLHKLATGAINIVIGTHALFQKEVVFQQLGLIIIDEQHRFGVHQRLTLLNKGIEENIHPHQLIMSATPIPRTLAMTAYADLDCSIIDELPPGRTPVKTIILPNHRRPELMQRIKENCLKGSQTYWVCTLIEESESLQCQAAEAIVEELILALPELRIGLVHGRMKSREKEQIMMHFKNKEMDLLVATTVIEVGVDIPNANLMVIENPERLGLAQLHQLRGRVGRGGSQSHCVLMYQPPLSKFAKERLAVMRDTNDGFIIAEKDLALRGPGEVLGTRQTGLVEFKIANLVRDQSLLPEVQNAALIFLKDYPEIVDAIITRWLANKDIYSEV